MSEDDIDLSNDLFHEEDPPTPPPVFVEVGRGNGATIKLRLVNKSPLWGHLLWSASKVLARYLEANKSLYRDKYVLELGAAAGLPSIICALEGAKKVIVTDYPDPDLLYNIRCNLETAELINASVKGYIWGRDAAELLEEIDHARFDLLILSDLIFNHQAHPALLQTCKDCLSDRPGAQILVFFTHHRPHLADKDNAFFTLASEQGFLIQKIMEDRAEENIMFENDPGSSDVRATVHGYSLTFSSKSRSS
jgi:EEF1A N-terminal glycine/lysine methyltransferase